MKLQVLIGRKKFSSFACGILRRVSSSSRHLLVILETSDATYTVVTNDTLNANRGSFDSLAFTTNISKLGLRQLFTETPDKHPELQKAGFIHKVCTSRSFSNETWSSATTIRSSSKCGCPARRSNSAGPVRERGRW